MNDSAMQLMLRERRESIFATAGHLMTRGMEYTTHCARSDESCRTGARASYRAAPALGFAMAWGVAIVTVMLVGNLHAGIQKMMEPAAAPDALVTSAAAASETVSGTFESDGDTVGSASEVRSAMNEVRR